ncbi:hypothetical protein [Tianweitania sp.]|uniref:hypothetical protein n=1 Tax=Tianweitania sp. TaxID=2021634 RepID=UPI0028A10C0A|nr:hypothetical protein [Tianweitania sp.]
MSDGPHRSLLMPRAWKEFARKGDATTYAEEEVRDAAVYALARDFANEVSGPLLRALRDIFDGVGNSLKMIDVASQAIEDAKHMAAGSVFGLAAVRWCEEFVLEGSFGRDRFHEAVGCAVKERGYAGQKQVQEHYLRKSGTRRSDGVAARIGSAINSLNSQEIGRSFSDDGERAKAPRKSVGMDEGVRLS